MQQHVLFRARQRFRQWWLWGFLIAITALFIIKIIFPREAAASDDRVLGTIGLFISLGLTAILLLFSLLASSKPKSVSMEFMRVSIPPT